MNIASRCQCLHRQYSALILQFRDSVEVGVVLKAESELFYYWSHTDFYGVGTDLYGVSCSARTSRSRSMQACATRLSKQSRRSRAVRAHAYIRAYRQRVT